MNSNESMHDLMHPFSRSHLINEDRAIRLYNSVIPSNIAVQSFESLATVCSANELGQSCRICRWNQHDLLLQQCPCECKGSVGYVHLKCLRRWILHRGDDHCEICGTRFRFNHEKRNYKKMFWSFFQSKYIGGILKNCIHLITLAPISYVVLYQVLQIVDVIQFEEHNTLQIVLLTPALLLTSSIILFHIIEFSISRCLAIKNILKHWWNFAGQDSGLDMDVPSDISEFF